MSKDKNELKEQLSKMILPNLSTETEKLLMQDAIESGELTKAFAQAWANKEISDREKDTDSGDGKDVSDSRVNRKNIRRGIDII